MRALDERIPVKGLTHLPQEGSRVLHPRAVGPKGTDRILPPDPVPTHFLAQRQLFRQQVILMVPPQQRKTIPEGYRQRTHRLENLPGIRAPVKQIPKQDHAVCFRVRVQKGE